MQTRGGAGEVEFLGAAQKATQAAKFHQLIS